MRRYGHAAVVYAVLLHVLVGVLVAKTDFLPRVGKRLGLVPPDEREEWFAELVLPVVEQVRPCCTDNSI